MSTSPSLSDPNPSGAEALSSVEGLPPAQEPEIEKLSPLPSTAEAPSAPPPPPATFTRNQIGCAFLLSFFLTLGLSLLLTLGILASLNGGLRFASPAQVASLGARMDAMETRIGQLSTEINTLRERVSSLEALGKRVTTVEQTTRSLNESVETLSRQADENASRLDAMQKEFKALQEQNGRIQSFLEGLRDLLTGIFPPEVNTP